MILGVLTFIGLILYFILPGGYDYSNDPPTYNYGKIVVNDSFECVMLVAMIVASVWAYYSIYKLDINPNPISFLDDLLLIICMPSFFLYGTLNIISGVGGNYLESSVPTNIFMVGTILISFSL